MNSRVLALFAAISLSSVAAFAQAQDGPFQVRYASNLASGDSVVNITNTGASSSRFNPLGGVQNGDLCVNVYAFSPDEQLIECCSCLVTPNGLVSLSARKDLISNTLTPGVPGSIVIKLLSTLAGTSTGGLPTGRGNSASCNAALPDITTAAGTAGAIAPGLAAWGTTIHALPGTTTPPAFGVTETPFTNSTLSAAELSRITNLCAFNQSNGSRFGVCASCTPGGQGAVRQ